MAMTDIEKIMTVFQGISARNGDLATKYINPEEYIEHNPRAANGAEGLRQYIRDLPPENHLNVVRAFQDGLYVFTQAEGLILSHNVFFDLFRLKDGLIVEHWVFSAKGAPPNLSGHTQIDGPTQAKSSEDKDKNKALVREYYEAVHLSRDDSKIPQYFAGDHCIRHEPGVRDGTAAFKQDLERLINDRTIDEIEFVLGQGDFVFIAARGTHQAAPCVYIDLYRVEDGKIAERWGFPEPVPEAGRKNHNGML